MKYRKQILRMIACCMIMIFCANSVLAGPPQPQTDEAVYINLDVYGTPEDVRVVKGVTRNGATQISDYGTYAQVHNLTSHDVPQMREDGVDFTLEHIENDRFYYECVMNETNELQAPWTFDVSYALNGKPCKAEDLAGVTGLVEITLHAIPNPNVSTYMKNNMVLMAGTGINMDHASTLEAPGAQIQSFGSYKFAVYVGLPGEEATYTLRIGAEDFEFSGIYILIAPATISQLDTLDSLKKAKDDIWNTRNDVYQSLQSLLTTMGNMQTGLQTMQSGISALNETRTQWINQRETIDKKTDQALTQLEQLSGDTQSLLPSLQQAQTDCNNIHAIIDTLLTILHNTQSEVTNYQTILKELAYNLNDTQQFIKNLSKQIEYIPLSELEKEMNHVSKNSQSLSDVIEQLRQSLTTLRETETHLQNIISHLPAGGTIHTSLQHVLHAMVDIANSTDVVLVTLTDGSENISDLLAVSADISKELSNVQDLMVTYSETAEYSVAIAEELTQQIQYTLVHVQESLQIMDGLQIVLKQVNQNANTALQKTSNIVSSLHDALSATNDAVTETKNTLRSLRTTNDDATQQTINGLLDTLEQASSATNTTNDLQQATDSIHNTISNEVDELESKSNLLNIDTTSGLQSVTSPKNPTPESVQFIIRTQEIVVDEMEEVQQKIQQEQEQTVFSRIGAIFEKIIDGVKSVFSS